MACKRKSNKNTGLWTLVCALVALTAISAYGDEKTNETTAKAVAAPVIVVGVPIEASARTDGRDTWLGGLTEQLMHFRLSANRGMSLVASDRIHGEVKRLGRKPGNMSSANYREIGKKLGATHILQINYEISRDNKTCDLMAEMYSPAGLKDVGTLEKSFLLTETTTKLESIVAWVCGQLEIDASEELSRFYSIPAAVGGLKELKALGNLAVSPMHHNKDKAYAAAQQLMAIVDQDSRNLLANFLAAKAYASAGDFSKTATLYKDLIAVVPNHTGLYVEACRSFRLSGKYTEALEFARTAEKKNIKSTELLLEGGLSLEALGKSVTAGKVFETVLEENPNQPDALLFFARSKNKDGEYEEAAKIARHVLAVDENRGEAHLELGSSLLNQKKYDEAIAQLLKAEELLPEDIVTHRLLGDCYVEEKEYDKAASHYEKVLTHAPKSFYVHMKVADAWENAKDLDKAVASLSKAERVFPDSLILQKKMGLLHHKRGNSQGAILHLQRFVDKGPGDAKVFMALGTIYSEQKKFEKAFFMFNHAMPLVEDKNVCRKALAKLYLSQGNPNAAITHLLDIVKEDPKYPEVQRLLADGWFEIGTLSEALNCYTKARALEGENTYVQSRIAHIQFVTNNLQTAENEYESLLKLDPKHVLGHYRLAIIALENEDVRRAEDFRSKADKLGKPDSEICFRLATGYDKVKKPRKAIEAYTCVLEEQPRHEDALVRLADAYLEIDAKKNAAQTYVKLFEIDNAKYSKYLAQAGFLSEKANDIPRAQELFNIFLDKGYVNPSVNLHLARLDYSFKMYSKVVQLLGTLDNAFLQDPEFIKILGESYFQTEQYAQAAPWLEKAVQSDENDMSSLEMLAKANEKTGHIGKARETYMTLYELVDEKKKPDYAFHIGELFELDNDKDNAVEQYKKNAKNYPEDTRNYDRLASLYLEWNDLASARGVLEAVTSLEKPLPGFDKRLAEVYLMQNDRLNAVRRYKKYLDLVPNDFDAWHAVGGIYFVKRVYSKAAYAYDKASKLKPGDIDSWHQLGICGRRTGRVEEAVVALNKAHEIDPNKAAVLHDLAECHRIRQNIDPLIATLVKLTALEPNNFEIKAEYGTLLVDKKRDLDNGVAVLEEAVKLNDNDPTVRITLARAYESKVNNKARYSHLKTALEKNPGHPEVQYETGRYFASQGDMEKAEQHFASAIVRNPNHAPCLFAYSVLLYQQGRVAESYAHIQNAVRHDSYSIPSLVHYARVAWDMGQKEQAISTINSALSVDSTAMECLSLAGYLYKESKRIDEAKMILEKGISLHPACAVCYTYLGDIYNDEMRYVNAAGYYTRALEKTGEDRELRLKLADSYRLACQDDKARQYYEQVLNKDNEVHEAFYRLAHLYIRVGNSETAREMLKQRSRGKKTIWHHMVRGELQEIKGNIDEALTSFQVALRLQPDLSEAYAGVGRIDLARGEYTTAIVNFGKALAKDPYNQYLLLDLGKAYEGIGEFNSAYEIYSEVSTKYPQVAQAYYQLSDMKNRQKEYQHAIEVAKKGLEASPANANLHMALADAYRLTSEYQKAVDSYTAAIKNCNEKCIEAYAHLANLYSKHLNNPKEGQKYAKRYIKAGGDETKVANVQ